MFWMFSQVRKKERQKIERIENNLLPACCFGAVLSIRHLLRHRGEHWSAVLRKPEHVLYFRLRMRNVGVHERSRWHSTLARLLSPLEQVPLPRFSGMVSSWSAHWNGRVCEARGVRSAFVRIHCWDLDLGCQDLDKWCQEWLLSVVMKVNPPTRIVAERRILFGILPWPYT